MAQSWLWGIQIVDKKKTDDFVRTLMNILKNKEL